MIQICTMKSETEDLKGESRHELDPDQASFEVTCRLIPLGVALSFMVLFVLLSAFSWLILRNSMEFVYVSIALQALLIPLVLYRAARMKVRFSRHGIEVLSTMHSSAMNYRLSRSWSDLHSVRLRRFKSPEAFLERLAREKRTRFESESLKEKLLRYAGKGWLLSGFLVMDFKSGGMAPFPLAGFSSSDLEDLFLAISSWADPMVLNPDVIALERNVLTGQAVEFDASYTKMWEENLRNQFEVTNFVPLAGGASLQGGSIRVMMLLACGGMSSIYLARLRDDTRVVLKELRVPLDSDLDIAEKVHEMFAREARILSSLDHPCIVRVLDHFVEKGQDYMVLEYLPGLTLRQHVQMHGPFSSRDVIKIGMSLAKIVQYLHEFSPPILHRDLTPDNLILKEPEKDLVLVDFGAANEFIGEFTGTLVGKQSYIPPEQFRGQAVPESDIYAVGATLYYLLTGKDPEPITPSRPKEIVDTIADDLDQLIYDCTREAPEDRGYDAANLYWKLCELGGELV